jgi:glycosyltransferase involved in cell wall biosynthesis
VAQCVWYVSKYVITPVEGEPAGRSYALMREIADLGYEAVIVTSDSMGMFDAPVAERSYQLEGRDGIALCRIRTLKYKTSKSLRRILSWIDFEWRLLWLPDADLPRPDAVVVSSLSLLTVLNGLRLRRRHGCRLIFEVRDIWPLTLTEEGGFSTRNPLVIALGAVEKLGYRRADAIVGTMPNLGQHVEERIGTPRPAFCIPMGVDLRAVDSPVLLPAEYVATYVPKADFLVAYAGSIGISNALDVFFECVESLSQQPGIQFVVVGDGDLRDTYERRFGSLPNLTFAPRIPKAMVHDFLSHADLLYLSVHNSAVWDFGLSLNKLIDYMLAGKPIVASYSGYPSMIDEAECGTFVPAGDAEALRDELVRLANMPPAERAAIGERGRAWLLEHRDYRVLAREYLRILFPDGEVLPRS